MESLKIAITQRVVSSEYNEKRDALSHDWVHFLQKLNILPLIIPNTLNNVDAYLDFFHPDGFILTGGNNVSPVLYGGNEVVSDISEERDQTERNILTYAIRNNLPLIGICRGMQVIQVYFGGKLKRLLHQPINHGKNIHKISIVNNHFKIRFNSEKPILVNSYHNYGFMIDNIAEPLLPFAQSIGDGVVEGLFHPHYPIIGIQWHPERESELRKIDWELFNLFYNYKCDI